MTTENEILDFPTPNNNPSPKENGLAIATLVLGILGLLFSLIPCFIFFTFPLCILSIIFGIISYSNSTQKNEPKTLAIAGLACAIIGMLITIYYFRFH